MLSTIKPNIILDNKGKAVYTGRLQEAIKKYQTIPVRNMSIAKPSVVKNIVTGIAKDPRLTTSISPVAAAGAGATVLKAGPKIASAGRSVIQSLKNPLAGGVPKFLQTVGGRTLMATTFLEAGSLAYSSTSGKTYKPFSLENTGLIFASALNPISAVVGGLAGYGTKGATTIKDIFQQKTEGIQNIDYGKYLDELKNLQPNYTFNVNTSTPTVGGGFPVSGAYAPSVNINPSVGGGYGDYAMMLALIGLAGGLGYVVGKKRKKKRKKKKYKKGRKR